MGLVSSCLPKQSDEKMTSGSDPSSKYDWNGQRAIYYDELDMYFEKVRKNTIRVRTTTSTSVEMQAYNNADDAGKLVHQTAALVALEMVHRSQMPQQYTPSLEELQRRLEKLRSV